MNKKRGQVTIFIIVAIIIVALAVLIYFLFPGIPGLIGFEESPSVNIENCVKDYIEENQILEKISSQGGSLSPEHYIMYDNEKLEYLCYTNEYYVTCVMQQPMLKEHIESEIEEEISSEVRSCFNDLKASYESKGYNVNLRRGNMSVELLPKRIVVSANNQLTLTKGGESKNYNSFDVILNNNLYELVSIAKSILNWEARYGDAETTIYMNYYHDLKVEKIKQGDGSTVYIITDRNTLDKFQFASRSVAWPPGYGVNEEKHVVMTTYSIID